MSQDTSAPVSAQETVHEYLSVRRVHEEPDLLWVRLAGEIDIGTADTLRRALAADHVSKLLVDLTRVTFLALAGVRVLRLVGQQHTAANRRMVVAAPTLAVQRVLSLTDVAAHLEIYVSVPSARAALTG